MLGWTQVIRVVAGDQRSRVLGQRQTAHPSIPAARQSGVPHQAFTGGLGLARTMQVVDGAWTYVVRMPAANHYTGNVYSELFARVSKGGAIVPASMSPDELLSRLRDALRVRLAPRHGQIAAVALSNEFMMMFENGVCTLGSPALTNIAHGGSRPFASCAAVPGPTSVAESYYAQNMGAGYNLHDRADPVAALVALNDHAEAYEASGACERYVGNMAHVSAHHPRVREFVAAKVSRQLRHVNISIDFSAKDIEALLNGDAALSALLDEIATCSLTCGDPGIISLDRFNAANALAGESRYTTTAPCAEVGLAPGDTCLFGYINIAALLTDSDDDSRIAVDELRRLSRLLATVLDSLVDASAELLPTGLSRELAVAKRRIGIGICGYADLLAWLNLPYGGADAVALLDDVLSVVQFEAKSTSTELAQAHGAFAAWPVSIFAGNGWLAPPPSRFVSEQDWHDLTMRIADSGLRNAASTALPPSGRASMLLGVNGSIEPFLSDPAKAAHHPALRAGLGRLLPTDPRRRSAPSIPWREHLDTMIAASRWLDEGISKTVNLPPTATVNDVRDLYQYGLRGGLRAISVYRIC